MSRKSIIVALSALVASLALLTGTAAAQQGAPAPAAKAKTLKLVRTWSYVGPRGMLAGAKITLEDATGTTIASGTTSKTGSYAFDLSSRASVKLPLTVSTSGGTATALLPSGTFVRLGAFKGHLSSKVFNATTKEPITQVSLLSTAATLIAAADTRKAYGAALAKVERALGFSKTAPSDILRLRNRNVGFKQLLIASRRAGGFDAFAARVAEAAMAGKKVRNLRPPSANASGAISLRLIRGGTPMTRQSSSSGPICSQPLPSGPSQSDQLITDVAEIGVGALMKVAGTPSSASASITGMAFAAAGVPTSDSTAEAANAAIYNELLCIDEQLVVLTEAVDQLSLTADLTDATNCADAIGGPNAWQGYEDTIGAGTSAPLDTTDPSVTGLYIPTWNTVSTTCGSGVNGSLWGSSGGNKSAWQQVVYNTAGSSKWWTQAQNQQMQTFLSYWGTVLYQQFILSNEYDNYEGYLSAAKNAAGAWTNSAGQTVCNTGSTTSTKTFCVWRSNIVQAYPGDLYSDELGVVKNGMGVNAIPMGVFSPKPIMNPAPSGMASSTSKFYSQTPASAQQSGGITSVNPGWFFNYYLNFTPYNGSGEGNQLRLFNFGTTPTCLSKELNPCPGPTTTTQSASFAWNSVNYFNGLGINPKGYGTAVETYNNPQSVDRTPNNPAGGAMQCSDASDINSTNNQGTKGITALYNTLNQAPSGGSGPLDGTGYGSGDVLYMVNDGNSYVTMGLGATQSYFTWNGCMGNMKSGAAYALSVVPIKPLFATLTGRTWWTGASKAATFTPSNPQTS